MNLSNALFFSVALAFSAPAFANDPAPTEGAPESKECVMQEGVDGASCQRCGDGYCAKSCENEKSCPQDCGVES